MSEHAPAREPNDLAKFFIERANAGDVAGLVALYTEDATLDIPGARTLRGHGEISAFYERFLESRPTLTAGEQRPALVSGDVALTSTRLLDGSATAEVAVRQADGSWRWAVDQPRVV